MLRLSMLGWVGVAFLVIAISAGTNAVAQTAVEDIDIPPFLPDDTPYPRSCVVDVKVTDTCPDVAETKCPEGSCSLILGCRAEDGTKVDAERIPKNPGATVQAAKAATTPELDQAFLPNVPDSPVTCYRFRFCYCRTIEPGQTICVKGDNWYDSNIYSWTASKDPCLVPVPRID
jgi:hypothetical protein